MKICNENAAQSNQIRIYLVAKQLKYKRRLALVGQLRDGKTQIKSAFFTLSS